LRGLKENRVVGTISESGGSHGGPVVCTRHGCAGRSAAGGWPAGGPGTARRRPSGSPARDYTGDLERILIHEIYGHAVPWLLAGHVRGRCADPVEGEDPASACSMVRENAVRVEAGFGRRADYALSGLALGRAPQRSR